jgi:hypothetical protein
VNASSESTAGNAARSSPDNVKASMNGEAANVASSSPAAIASKVPQIRTATTTVATTMSIDTAAATILSDSVEPPPSSRRPR